MTLRLSNAVRSLLRLLGVPATEEGIASALNPFIGELPAPVPVSATGSPPAYQIVCSAPHVRVATGEEGAPVSVILPVPSECPRGMLFSVDLHKEEGGSEYAILSDGTKNILIVPRKYQFVIANGNSISFLNDWYLWGTAITEILINVGSPDDEFGVDKSLRAYVGTPEMEADPNGPLWAVVKDLQDRVGTIEGA